MAAAPEITNCDKYIFVFHLLKRVLTHHLNRHGANSVPLPAIPNNILFTQQHADWIDDFISTQPFIDCLDSQIYKSVLACNIENLRILMNCLKNEFFYSKTPDNGEKDFVCACAVIGYAAYDFGNERATPKEKAKFVEEAAQYLQEWILSEDIRLRFLSNA
ncbi:hypothetical protein AVEN_70256-1 [Araneus ventricosus]|uniref:Uncharacterized protein n=1 Tax=Araneus ventricosus TaxID=182803 RepID=A0A4Y2GF35_ARAVE|nr:hypothetical protein AVEN_70256-1 [Araneus ventricosus]